MLLLMILSLTYRLSLTTRDFSVLRLIIEQQYWHEDFLFLRTKSCRLPSCTSPSTFTNSKGIQVVSFHLLSDLCCVSTFKDRVDVPSCDSYH